MPTLSTRTLRWQALYREKLRVFEGPFNDLYYNMACDPADNDAFYLFSPETIMKISQSNEVDYIENLYIRGQYEKALQLVNSTYTYSMLEKVQSAYFNDLIQTG